MKDRKKTNFVIIAVLLLVVGISIGYAALTATLTITGNTTINKHTWDVHFENLNVTQGSITATTPAAIDDNKLDINYAITLAKPGDFYEFTVDVKNGGTLPAKLASTPEILGLSNAQKVYTVYSVTYSNGTAVQKDDLIAANASRTIKVRVQYRTDITGDQLPSTEQNAELTFGMNFIQGN